jgi:hypothetical protein
MLPVLTLMMLMSPIVDIDAKDAARNMATLAGPAPPISGTFSHYGIMPTIGTIQYQQEMGRLPLDLSPYDGVIAVLDCSLVGQEAWISVEDSDWLSVIIFDCAGDTETVEWMKSGNVIGELSYHLAEELGTLGRGVPGELSLSEDIHGH